MKEICRFLGIDKTRTTPFHPQSDGQVERFKRTLVEMLRAKVHDDQTDWDTHLTSCLMAYISSVHESTGETPNQLMLGREVEMPLDVITEQSPDVPPFKSDYVDALRRRLASAHETARGMLKKCATKEEL